MQFNAFVWQNFLESQKGQRWANFFLSLGKHYDKRSKELQEFLSHWMEQALGDSFDTDAEIEKTNEFRNILRHPVVKRALEKQGLPSFDDATRYFDDLSNTVIHINPNNYAIKDAFVLTNEADYERFLESSTDWYELYLRELDFIPALSVALHIHFPNYFFPYYFYPQFHVLKKISDEFGIFLPPVPPKKDIIARFRYYLELCQSFYSFWTQLGLDSRQIPVFLYGFAPNVVDLSTPPPSELPAPRRAWFVGGGKDNNGDFEYLDKINSNSSTFWQGNAETEVGDIIVMYCLTPRSYIHSIWRAVRPGAVEPFRFFYQTVWIGYPQMVTPITLSEQE